MKLLLLLLPFTFHAQSSDSLQQANAQLNHEYLALLNQNAVLKGLIKDYVAQIKSLNTIQQTLEHEHQEQAKRCEYVQLQLQEELEKQAQLLEANADKALQDSLMIEELSSQVRAQNKENTILREIMKSYVSQHDSLVEVNRKLSTDKEQLVSKRKVIHELMMDETLLEGEIIVKLKLTIDAAGRVITATVMDETTTKDAKILEQIISAAKSNLRYSPLDGAELQFVFYTVKIVPN